MAAQVSGRLGVGRRVTCRIVDAADGRFAVVAVTASGATYRREGLLTLAEAEAGVEDLRATLAGCGVVLVPLDHAAGGPEAWPC